LTYKACDSKGSGVPTINVAGSSLPYEVSARLQASGASISLHAAQANNLLRTQFGYQVSLGLGLRRYTLWDSAAGEQSGRKERDSRY
jgi:hypothetical protein